MEDGEDEDFDALGNHVYMELQSTVAFKEVDIDQMLQHTSMDDFLRGLYVRATNTGVSTGKSMSQHDRLLAQLMDTRDESKEDAKVTGKPTLDFTEGEAEKMEKQGQAEKYRSDNLRKQAIQNLKERRQRQKQSEIFNKQEMLAKKDDEQEDIASVSGVERIDLTKTQMA